jgi:hypothetical protein
MFLRAGDPAKEIIRFAQEGGEDAIILVRRSELEWPRRSTPRLEEERS